MTKSNTRREYISRINRVIDYIQQNLDKKLLLAELSGIAAFSPFHFHRVFRGIVGEGLSEYITRLRLQYAAHRLKYHPAASVTEIALDCGFASPAGFTRAFKQYYGSSPSQFRGNQDKKDRTEDQKSKSGKAMRKKRQINSKPGKAISLLSGFNGFQKNLKPIKERRNKAMKVEVKNLPEYRVAYVRVMDGYNSSKITKAFEKVIKWARARDLMGPQSLVLGIGLDNPEVTPLEKCRYDACVTVPAGTKGEGEIGVYDIPQGKYAVCRVEGEYAKINEQMMSHWQRLMSEWFPDSGYQPDDRPCFEIYRETEAEFNAGKYVVDICEPVKPL
jgi:AraC family transcriptional regulator